MATDEPTVLWTPTPERIERASITRFARWVAASRGVDVTDSYDALWRWSVDDLDGFWASIWDYFGVRAHTPYEAVLGSRALPGAEWFPGARVNYAEHMVGAEDDLDAVAVVARSQARDGFELTFGELR